AVDERADEAIAHAVTAIQECPAPVVACLRGHCRGAAVELALSCDLRIAADDIQLSLGAVRLGVVYRTDFLALLVQLCGFGRSVDLMLEGRVLDGHTAQSWGLLSEVVPADELDDHCMRVAMSLAEAPRAAAVGTKRSFQILRKAKLN